MAGYGASPPRDDDDEGASTCATQADFQPEFDDVFEILAMRDEGYSAVTAITAGDKTIRARYPRQVRKVHPDKCKDADAPARFRRLQGAYE